MVLGVSSAWADEEELTLNNNESVSGTYVTFTFAQGSNSNNAPVLNSEQVRLYPGNTVTVSSTAKKITQIDLTVAVNANKKGTIPTSVTVSNGSCNDLSSLETSTNSATWTSSTGAGESEIVFTVNGTAGNIHFITAKVYYAGGDPVSVTGITLEDSATVEEGKTITLTPTISPDNATNKTINWASSNNEVATVANGVVTGVAEGTATITATTTDGSNISATCNVTVTKPEFIFYESFDQNTGKGGNDNQWSGSVGSGTIITDNTGWSFTKGSGNSQCAKLGTSSVKGSATTPSLGQAGNLIVSFKAGAWDGDQTELVLSVNGGGTLSTETVTMANAAWTDYEVIIYGATAETNLTFAGTQNDKARFFLDEVKVKEAVEKVTVTDALYATLCADKALDFTGLKVKAYMATMVDNNNVVTFTPVTKVPAGAGVLLKADKDGEYEVPVTASADELTGNILVGVTETYNEPQALESGYSYYVLRNQNNNVGFYKITASSYQFKKGTAYLEVAGSNAKTFIGFDGTETAVEAVAAQEQFAGELYNLQGQRVGNDYKGIVIVNGKKVIR